MTDAQLRELAAAFGLDAEELEERAAVRQFDGGLERGAANREAVAGAVARLVLERSEMDYPA